jgi:hypothetical protein
MRISKTPDLTALAKRLAPKVGASPQSALAWLRAGTKPKNPIVAAKWAKLLAKAKP